jgi:prepilin-type N-terminal cleavage/methylation domain-containing protein
MRQPFFNRGFSFIELIISIAVFTLITSAMLVSFSRLQGDVSLTNLAYDTALTIRQAQSYGVQVRGRDLSGSLSFDSGYGVRFATDSYESFMIFADDPLAGGCSGYDRKCTGATLAACGASTDLIKRYKIVNWNSISKFCAVDNSNVEYCSDSIGANHIDYLDISFLRPRQEAFIRTSLSASNACGVPALPYKSAYIRLVSAKGKTKIVNVTVTGQITVN